MEQTLERFVDNLLARWGGPLSPRFLLQPAVAVVLAIVAGLRDARADRPPFGWALVSDPALRGELLRCGWRDVRRLFAMALLIDVGYQLYLFRWVYPGEALVTAAVLALVPYLFVRGLVNRLAQLWCRRTPPPQAAGQVDGK